jgi:hypothetical protein
MSEVNDAFVEAMTEMRRVSSTAPVSTLFSDDR